MNPLIGSTVFYRKKSTFLHEQDLRRIAIHYDAGSAPYYTVRFCSGAERQTELDALTVIPAVKCFPRSANSLTLPLVKLLAFRRLASVSLFIYFLLCLFLRLASIYFLPPDSTIMSHSYACGYSDPSLRFSWHGSQWISMFGV